MGKIIEAGHSRSFSLHYVGIVKIIFEEIELYSLAINGQDLCLLNLTKVTFRRISKKGSSRCFWNKVFIFEKNKG